MIQAGDAVLFAKPFFRFQCLTVLFGTWTWVRSALWYFLHLFCCLLLFCSEPYQGSNAFINLIALRCPLLSHCVHLCPVVDSTFVWLCPLSECCDTISIFMNFIKSTIHQQKNICPDFCDVMTGPIRIEVYGGIGKVSISKVGFPFLLFFGNQIIDNVLPFLSTFHKCILAFSHC